MQKTSLGLTRLAPGEPIYADNFSFQDQNPFITNQLLEYAAFRHRHDEHVALANPVDPPTVATAAVGGQIPADATVYVGYTYTDADGGETAMNPEPVTITMDGGLAAPIDAPAAALDHAAGTLLAGSYTYGLTVTDGFGGETALSPTTTVLIPSGNATNEIIISGLVAYVADNGGAGYRLWRRVNGGVWGLVTDGAADTVTDDGTLCLDCTVTPPTSTGSTRGTNALKVTVPAPLPAGVSAFTIYGTLDGTFSSPALLGTFAPDQAGVEQVFTDLEFGEGAPPEETRALPGASKIDALTQIINLPIGAPVATAADLPAGTIDGEIRITLDDSAINVWDGAAWSAFTGGGGGGGGLSWAGVWNVGTAYDDGALVRHVGADDVTRLYAATKPSTGKEPVGNAPPVPVTFRDTVALPAPIGTPTPEHRLIDSGWQTQMRFPSDPVMYAWAYWFDVDVAGTVTIDFAPGPSQAGFEDTYAQLYKAPTDSVGNAVGNADEEHGAGFPNFTDFAVTPGRYYVLFGPKPDADVVADPAATYFTMTVTPGTATISNGPPWEFVFEDAPTPEPPPPAPTVMPSRASKNVNFGPLALNASVNVDIALAKTYALLSVYANSHIRLRLYATSQQRTDDAARAIGTAIPLNAGCIVDRDMPAFTTSGFTPAVIGWDHDFPGNGMAYARITALEAIAGATNISLTYVKMED